MEKWFNNTMVGKPDWLQCMGPRRSWLSIKICISLCKWYTNTTRCASFQIRIYLHTTNVLRCIYVFRLYCWICISKRWYTFSKYIKFDFWKVNFVHSEEVSAGCMSFKREWDLEMKERREEEGVCVCACVLVHYYFYNIYLK